MTPDELDNAFVKVRDELKMTSREARQKAEDEIRAYVEMLEEDVKLSYTNHRGEA